MVKLNTTVIVAIVSMGITIACFALLLKFLIPPLVSKESLIVFLSMILMLNVEYIILLKSYELDLLYKAYINRIREDAKYEKEMMESLDVMRGMRTQMTTEEINEEIQKYRGGKLTSISRGEDDEQFVIHFDDAPKEPTKIIDNVPEINTLESSIPESIQPSMKDIIEEAERQLMNTLKIKPVEKTEVYNEPIQDNVVYGNQTIAKEYSISTGLPIITEKAKPKVVTKRKAVLRKKR